MRRISQSAIQSFISNHFLMIFPQPHTLYVLEWAHGFVRGISSIGFKDVLRKDTFKLAQICTWSNCTAHPILSLYFKELGNRRLSSRIQGDNGVLKVVTQESLSLGQWYKCQGVKNQEKGFRNLALTFTPSPTSVVPASQPTPQHFHSTPSQRFILGEILVPPSILLGSSDNSCSEMNEVGRVRWDQLGRESRLQGLTWVWERCQTLRISLWGYGACLPIRWGGPCIGIKADR